MIGASRRLLFGICGLALYQAAVWGQSVPLLGDAYILPGNPGNVGSAVTVNVGGALGFQGLFLFDLTKLPPGTTASSISSASLRLFVDKVGGAGSINIYAASSSWSESTVTGTSGLNTSTFVAGPIAISVANSYVSIPVTSQLQAWLNGAPNTGLMILPVTTSTSLSFDSKENTSTSHPAVLEVVLTPAAGTNGGAGAPGAQGPTGATGAVGATGPVGDAGLGGQPGATGPLGPVGPQGPTGAVGVTGAKGVTGASPTGPPGLSGPLGPSGPSGAAGVTGSDGATGHVGGQGLPGNPGGAGPAGPSGPTGPPGLILNSFTVSSVQSSISNSLTQNVILVSNPAAEATYTLPAATTAGKEFIIVLNNYALTGANSILLTAPNTDPIIIGSATVCTSGCTNPSFPVNVWVQVVSDGNHHWFVPANN